MPNGDYTGGHGMLTEVDAIPRIVEWTIPDYFQLAKLVDYHITSPGFKYWQYQCKFVAWPNGTDCVPGYAKFKLHGIGLSGIDQWKLEVRRSDGRILRSYGGWKEDGREVKMELYVSADEVQKGCYGSGPLKVTCTLNCEETLKQPKEVKSCTNTGSQTEDVTRADKLSSDLEELLTTGKESDVTLRVNDEEFKTHKCILGARSPVFASMFNDETSECINNIVNVEDSEAVSFREFLRYLYTGRAEDFSSDTVFGVHLAAQKYTFRELKAYCMQYLKTNLSPDIYCDAVVLSLQYYERELMDIATRFLEPNLTEIKNSKQWENFVTEYTWLSDKLLYEASEFKKQREPRSPSPPKKCPWFHNLKNKFLKPVREILAGSMAEIHSIPKVAEWTITDFFQLPKEEGYTITSPSFKFFQHRSQLVALPNGTKGAPGIVKFTLNDIGNTRDVRCELEVRRTNGTILRKCVGSKLHGSVVNMDMLIPYNEILEGCYDSGIVRVKIKLFSNENVNYPDKEISVGDVASQTEVNSRTDKLSRHLEQLLISGDNSDVTIRIEDQEIKAHRCILETRAPLFMAMLRDKMAETTTDIVDIDDCDANTFRHFLLYIYTGRVEELSLNDISSLRKIAEKYEVEELKADWV